MINDVKKLASCVSNRPKAIKSFNILIELINGSIKEVPNDCFHSIETKTDEKSVLQNENMEIFNELLEAELNVDKYLNSLIKKLSQIKQYIKNMMKLCGILYVY